MSTVSLPRRRGDSRGGGPSPLLVSLCVVSALIVHAQTRAITWQDVAPLQKRLEANGISAETFASYVERVRRSNAERVREGDLDHLVFYVLQSTHFTSLPPIEPALSAKALVASGDASKPPAPVVARIAAFLRALDSSDRDARLAFFRGLAAAELTGRTKTSATGAASREAMLAREYLRAMKFVYEKEFVAQRSTRRDQAVVDLYRTRGLSTDTAVEAGFLVYQGLGVISSLEPRRKIRRVLIVGPGLDLAPRTAMVESGPPESYQPWTVLDALVALGLADVEHLEVVAADINPRVVQHLRRAQTSPPTLSLVTEIRESETTTLSQEYRDYFATLGRAIGQTGTGPPTPGHLYKTVRVRADVARTLRAEELDVVTERLPPPSFDLIVATNILPYFDDTQLMLAMTNIASMLGEGGIFLHNEARPILDDITRALALPVEQSRHAIIASVRGAPGLIDSVWLHRRAR